jgi:hypothetical protein
MHKEKKKEKEKEKKKKELYFVYVFIFSIQRASMGPSKIVHLFSSLSSAT